MRKVVTIFIILCALVLLFSGCRQIQNIVDPIPDEYTKGIEIPEEFPEDLEIYDGVVFEASDWSGEITIKYGVNRSLKSIVEFYEKLFKEKDFVVEKIAEDDNGYKAEGLMDGYTFELEVQRPSGSYEIRSYVWVVEMSAEPSETAMSEPTKKPADKSGESTPQATLEPVIIYPDSLDMITGFWQFCGGMESTDIYYKSHGAAINITEDMTITGYDNFEVVFEDIPFSFDGKDAITFKVNNEEQKVTFRFLNIYGDYEYLIMHGDNRIQGENVFSTRPEMILERTSYEDMLKHKGMKENYERRISLDEPISDEEMEFLIMETDWIASYNYYPDETTDSVGEYEMYRFNSGYVGIYADQDGNVYEFSWALADNYIFLYYHNGSEESFLLDYSNDEFSHNPSLYFFDEGRLAPAKVFIRFAC